MFKGSDYTLIKGNNFLESLDKNDIHRLGSGNSLVYRVYNNDRKRIEAMKEFFFNNEQQEENFLNEVKLFQEIQKQSNFPFVIQFYDYCVIKITQDKYHQFKYGYIIMERANFSLADAIERCIQKGQILQNEIILAFMMRMLKTFSELQKVGIAHRDIKPENILVFELQTLDCKICDVGSAKHFSSVSGQKRTQTITGTVPFFAPELVVGFKNKMNKLNHDSFKSDVFSMGLVLLYLLSGQRFHQNERSIISQEVYKEILDEWIEEAAQMVLNDQIIVETLRDMLQYDPSRRQDMVGIYQDLEKQCMKKQESMEFQSEQEGNGPWFISDHYQFGGNGKASIGDNISSISVLPQDLMQGVESTMYSNQDLKQDSINYIKQDKYSSYSDSPDNINKPKTSISNFTDSIGVQKTTPQTLDQLNKLKGSANPPSSGNASKQTNSSQSSNKSSDPQQKLINLFKTNQQQPIDRQQYESPTQNAKNQASSFASGGNPLMYAVSNFDSPRKNSDKTEIIGQNKATATRINTSINGSYNNNMVSVSPNIKIMTNGQPNPNNVNINNINNTTTNANQGKVTGKATPIQLTNESMIISNQSNLIQNSTNIMNSNNSKQNLLVIENSNTQHVNVYNNYLNGSVNQPPPTSNPTDRSKTNQPLTCIGPSEMGFQPPNLNQQTSNQHQNSKSISINSVSQNFSGNNFLNLNPSTLNKSNSNSGVNSNLSTSRNINLKIGQTGGGGGAGGTQTNENKINSSASFSNNLRHVTTLSPSKSSGSSSVHNGLLKKEGMSPYHQHTNSLGYPSSLNPQQGIENANTLAFQSKQTYAVFNMQEMSQVSNDVFGSRVLSSHEQQKKYLKVNFQLQRNQISQFKEMMENLYILNHLSKLSVVFNDKYNTTGGASPQSVGDSPLRQTTNNDIFNSENTEDHVMADEEKLTQTLLCEILKMNFLKQLSLEINKGYPFPGSTANVTKVHQKYEGKLKILSLCLIDTHYIGDFLEQFLIPKNLGTLERVQLNFKGVKTTIEEKSFWSLVREVAKLPNLASFTLAAHDCLNLKSISLKQLFALFKIQKSRVSFISLKLIGIKVPEEPTKLWEFPEFVQEIKFHIDSQAMNDQHYCTMVRNMANQLKQLRKVHLNLNGVAISKEPMFLMIGEFRNVKNLEELQLICDNNSLIDDEFSQQLTTINQISELKMKVFALSLVQTKATASTLTNLLDFVQRMQKSQTIEYFKLTLSRLMTSDEIIQVIESFSKSQYTGVWQSYDGFSTTYHFLAKPKTKNKFSIFSEQQKKRHKDQVCEYYFKNFGNTGLYKCISCTEDAGMTKTAKYFSNLCENCAIECHKDHLIVQSDVCADSTQEFQCSCYLINGETCESIHNATIRCKDCQIDQLICSLCLKNCHQNHQFQQMGVRNFECQCSRDH